MGIYSNSYIGQPSDYGYNETLDSIMLDESIRPCESDDLVAESYNIIYTMEENYNMLFTTLGINELRSIEEEEQKFVYTENVLLDIFRKVKSFVKKIWERIKGFFKKFILIIDGYTKNDKEFVNKYRKQIFSYKKLDDFEFKGYKWNIKDDKMSSLITSNSELTGFERRYEFDDDKLNWRSGEIRFGKEYLEKKNEDIDNVLDQERSKIIKDYDSKAQVSGGLSLDEFRSEFRKVLRGNQDSKEVLDKNDINIHEMVKILTDNSENKKALDSVFKTTKKAMEKFEKKLEELEKELDKIISSKDTTLVNDPRKPGKIPFGLKFAQKFNIDKNDQILTAGGREVVKSWARDNKQSLKMLNDEIAIERAIYEIYINEYKTNPNDSMFNIGSGPMVDIGSLHIKENFLNLFKAFMKHYSKLTGEIDDIDYYEFYIDRYGNKLKNGLMKMKSGKMTEIKPLDINNIDSWDQKQLTYALNKIYTNNKNLYLYGSGEGPQEKDNDDNVEYDEVDEIDKNGQKTGKKIKVRRPGTGAGTVLNPTIPGNTDGGFWRTEQGKEEKWKIAELVRIQAKSAPKEVRSKINNITVLDTEFILGIKDRSRQYKACLVKYITYKPKKEDSEFLTEQSDLVYNEEKQSIYRDEFVYNTSSSISNIRIL